MQTIPLIVILLTWTMSTCGLVMPTVSTFLKGSKRVLTEPIVEKVAVVLGNQASDADSIISSLCYAKFLQDRHQRTHLPLTCMSRRDLVFRREVQLLLNTVKVDLGDLVCIEDVPLQKLFDANCLSIVLSDHNELDHTLSSFSESVVEIIDHHADNGMYQWVKPDKRNIAFDKHTSKALVGSTCTLVAEKYFESLVPMCAEVATLLMGVIALDTINMDLHAGIGTERDGAALEKLRSISTHSQDELFELLRGAKLDPEFWRQLSVDDVLRIDYKTFQSAAMKEKQMPTLGMAAALMPLKAFLTKQDLYETAKRVMTDQKLGLLVVMTFVHQPAPHRELLLLADKKHEALYNAVLQYVQDGSQHSLNCSLLRDEHTTANAKFQPTSVSPDEWILSAALKQGDAKASRKQVAPLLTNFLGSIL